MPIASYKDLCIDAVDVEALGRFWAAVLDREFELRADGIGRLTGSLPTHVVWINPVPEPKSVKHRVHLDVFGESVDTLQRLGAEVIRPERRWTVMSDPEGGEFCLFARDTVPGERLYGVCVDVVDHVAAARWWQSVLGGDIGTSDSGYSWIEAVPHVPFEGFSFSSVPEAKAVKNRLHIDLFADDVDALVSAGATVVRRADDDIEWVVMADPDGNEFCVFTPR